VHQVPRKAKPKNLERIERRMPERGKTFFYPNPRHPSLDNPPRQQRARKGGDVFPKNKIYARCLDNEKITFRKATPSNNPLGRGETFFSKKHNPSAHNFRWQQLAPRRTQPAANIKRSSSNAQHPKLSKYFGQGTPTSYVRERGETFFLTFPSHIPHRVLTLLAT